MGFYKNRRRQARKSLLRWRRQGVSFGDALDEAEHSQPFELSRQRGGAELGNQGPQIGTAQAADVEFRAPQCPQQSLLAALEEVQSF